MATEQTGMEITQAGETLPARPEDESEVTSLVQLAIEKGVGVDVLERLVALQERVTERNARGAYFDALAAFQESVPQIPKSKRVNYVTKTGARIDYNYSPLDAIARAIRQPLKKHGLSYSWDVDSAEAGMMVVACTLRHVDGHSERSTFPVPIDSGAKMSAAQTHGAALMYGKRQSLVAVLGLTMTDDDLDGVAPNGASAEVETITDEQVADLETLMDEVGADRAKFLRFMRVEKLEDIRQGRQYADAVSALEQKRGR